MKQKNQLLLRAKSNTFGHEESNIFNNSMS